MDVRMSGWTDTPLSSEGIQQAQAVAAQLAHEAPSSIIYSSPLRRAQVTAELIAQAVDAALRIDPALCEIDLRRSRRSAAVRSREPLSGAVGRQLVPEYPDFRWPGGESYNELRDRVLSAAHRIARARHGERVTVVTHAGFISQLLGGFTA